MAIETVLDMKTKRTNPRLMITRTTKTLVMTLHDHTATSGFIYLGGLQMGKTVLGNEVCWDDLEDFHGSVTLWNKD